MTVEKLKYPMRRGLLAGSAAALFARLFVFASPTEAQTMTTNDRAINKEIRRFRVNFPDAQLADLRQRIKATKWPEREQVNDASQGVQLSTMQTLARYWATQYN